MKIEDYIKNFSFNIWEKKATFCIKKINKLKKQQNKIDYINDLYSIYLQLIENFIIFLLVRWSNNTIFLFEDSYSIITSFSKVKDNLIKWLLDEIFICLTNSEILNLRQKYEKLLKEVFNDYENDKNFLNSYKHWYRITWNSFNNKLYIWLEWNDKKFLFWNYKHNLSYLWVRKDRKKKISYIDEYIIWFDSNYIYWKIIFITDIIDKVKFLYKRYWKIKLNYLSLDDSWFLERKEAYRFCNKNKYFIKHSPSKPSPQTLSQKQKNNNL